MIMKDPLRKRRLTTKTKTHQENEGPTTKTKTHRENGGPTMKTETYVYYIKDPLLSFSCVTYLVQRNPLPSVMQAKC